MKIKNTIIMKFHYPINKRKVGRHREQFNVEFDAFERVSISSIQHRHATFNSFQFSLGIWYFHIVFHDFHRCFDIFERVTYRLAIADLVGFLWTICHLPLQFADFKAKVNRPVSLGAVRVKRAPTKLIKDKNEKDARSGNYPNPVAFLESHENRNADSWPVSTDTVMEKA